MSKQELVGPRPATPADLGAIHAIYAHHVLHGLGSFEEAPPTLEEMRGRFDEVVGRGLPFLALELDGALAGYGYCAPYRARSAYRYTLEDSVYVRPEMVGRGVGRALLGELIGRSAELGYRQLVAVIGDSANTPSVALHAAHGFLRVGTLRSVGFKFGRWTDTVIMQRPLGEGDATRPVSR
ncbi:MAG TPA: GNAT family N-acetyltransferase [Burkholderiales bacterium]|nr:GNAT family N-acetyltransferase [Burkholderiales bacterium]